MISYNKYTNFLNITYLTQLNILYYENKYRILKLCLLNILNLFVNLL